MEYIAAVVLISAVIFLIFLFTWKNKQMEKELYQKNEQIKKDLYRLQKICGRENQPKTRRTNAKKLTFKIVDNASGKEYGIMEVKYQSLIFENNGNREKLSKPLANLVIRLMNKDDYTEVYEHGEMEE